MTQLLPSRRQLPLFLLILAGLLLLHADTISTPPYWDMIIGAFAEAIWLESNDFDFLRLWTEEPRALAGGAAVYKISVLPALYAVLLRYFDTSTVFPVLHLFSILASAISLTLFFSILRNVTSNTRALCWTAVVLSNPLWSSQTASINMEMPLVAASTASIFYLQKQRHLPACLWACVAFLFKEPAIILLLALACWGPARSLMGLLSREGRVLPLLDRSNALLLAPLAFAFALKALVGEAELDTVDIVSGIRDFLIQMPFWLPMTAAQLGLVVVFSTIWMLKRVAGGSSTREARDTDSFVLLLAVLIFGFWASYWLVNNPLARYSLFVLIPMAALLALLVANTRLSLALALALVLFGAANHRGWLMGEVPRGLARAGQFLERNMEYVEDLEANRRLCRTLEESYFDTPIVANYPFVQMLTLPHLGYVERALPRVFAAGIVPTFANVESFKASPPTDPQTLFLYAPNNFSLLFMPHSLRLERGDEVVLREPAAGAPVIVYRKSGWGAASHLPGSGL